VQIVSKDEDSGKITVHNKKTGETVTINTNDYTADNIGKALQKFTQSAQAAAHKANAALPPNSGQSATLNGRAKKLPDYLPSYPGATTVSSEVQNLGGIITGNYVGSTGEKPDEVLAFYEQKLTAAGYTIAGKTSDSTDHGQTAVLSAITQGPQRNVTLSVESAGAGHTQIAINFVQLAN
jgi:hypothetical protein